MFSMVPPHKKKTDVTLPRTNSWQLSGFPKKEIHEFSNPRGSGAVFILKGFSCLLFSRGAGSMMVHGWVHGKKMDQAESEATQSSVKFPDFTGGLGPLAPPSNR